LNFSKQTTVLTPNLFEFVVLLFYKVFTDIQSVLVEEEQKAMLSRPEHVEENPYLAMAKQQDEKREAKRKKLLAQEAGVKAKK
jgi:hypothetical protein